VSIEKRKYMFSVKKLDANYELDYLESPYTDMDLSTSETFRITAPFVGRPDLISMKFFGTYNMGWLICLHNDFMDPINDLEFGIQIKIPDLDEYYQYYNANSRSSV
tara:strand:- start:115449 stop:115766 length:318 start_codon:yes stop_codon:yes gene_type:complete